jgi:hypothetical protein
VGRDLAQGLPLLAHLHAVACKAHLLLLLLKAVWLHTLTQGDSSRRERNESEQNTTFVSVD